MAQRISGALFPRPSLWSKPLRTAPLREPEEQQAIPAGAGDLACDRAQRSILPRFELKPLIEHFHHNLPIVDSAREQCSRRRQSLVPLRLSAIDRPRPINRNLSGQKLL